MVRIGIFDGDTPLAGELVRLLINHPDAEIVWVNSASLAGTKVADRHPGMIGETNLTFSDSSPIDDVDCVFVCSPATPIDFILDTDVKVIDACGAISHRSSFEPEKVIFGVPELCRKPMVRGGKVVSIPTPATMAVVTPLLPLAKNGLVNALVDASVDGVDDNSADMTLVKAAIASLQPEFGQAINVKAEGPSTRIVTASLAMASDIDTVRATEIFNDFFDDHNFVFVTKRMPAPEDVLNTNKFLINLQAENGILTMTAVFDSKLKGSAGTAVHAMNLLFGLHERVGLTLKAFV